MLWRHWQSWSKLPGVQLLLVSSLLLLFSSFIHAADSDLSLDSSSNSSRSLTCYIHPWESLEERCYPNGEVLDQCYVYQSNSTLATSLHTTAAAAAPQSQVVTSTPASQEQEAIAAPLAPTTSAANDATSSISAAAHDTTTITYVYQSSNLPPTSTTATGSPSSSPSSSASHDTLWTEIDDSLGQSWNPELEAEYIRAQNDIHLNTQDILADGLQPLPASTGSGDLHDDSGIPDFLSFEQWKQRHIAANIAAASSGHGKDHKKTGHIDRTAKDRDGKHDSASLGAQGDLGNGWAGDVSSPADPLGTDDITLSAAMVDSGAVAASSQRILQPIPHAGSGDPLLDPLISLRDRTNYASFDCSATLIRSSKLTKSASAILSSKKDRYMLTPCAEKEKFVIVELCDEIQIDTIVLANLEFFSSMFKLFRVSGGTAYPDNTGTWHDIGTFRAGNARGMQVFRPLEPTKGGFYRYIRIDFVSHYGTEYYCPVSLLKVYGLTQLDAYRRDEENQNRLADSDEGDILAQLDYDAPPLPAEKDEMVYLQLVEAAEGVSDMDDSSEQKEESLQLPPQSSTLSESKTAPSQTKSIAESIRSAWSTSISVPPVASDTPTFIPSSLHAPEAAISKGTAPDVDTTASTQADNSHTTRPPPAQTSSLQHTSAASAPLTTTPPGGSTHGGTTGVTSASGSLETSVTSSILQYGPSPSAASNSTMSSDPSKAGTDGHSVSQEKARSSSGSRSGAATLVYRTITAQPPPSGQQPPARRNDSRPQVIYTHNQGSQPQPNESIYGTIMKRLLALEVNTTLSTAYVEEHSRMVWETFRRIEERLASMEKSRSRYDQLLRRVMLDLELHRAKLEAERLEVTGQLSLLSREMVTEKRLGIAQLFALVVLLFFVVLTRGSPSSPLLSLTDPRSAASTVSSFPRVVKSRRPRSLRDEPIDHMSPIDFRSLASRERRGVGSDKRNSILQGPSSAGVSRTASIKRPYRTSNNMMKRPMTAVPLRRNGFEFAAGSPPSSSNPLSKLPLSAPLLESRSLSGESTNARSREATPVATEFESSHRYSAGRVSPADMTIRSSTPPLYPVPPRQRRSPVEALRHKLRLMQPRRSASLDEATGLPSPVESSSSSILDRRKRFSLGLASVTRPSRARSQTINSMTSDEGAGEGTSKAWLSTSEDSGGDEDDEVGGKAYTGVGASSFAHLMQGNRSALNNGIRLPPSPEPSDAEKSPDPTHPNPS